MKKIFKNWKWYELVFLAVSVIALTVSFIVGVDKNWLSYSTSVVGILGALLLAKGMVIAPFVIVVQGVLYSTLSYTQAYYGEMIIYIGIMIPISVLSIISWLRNRKKENNALMNVNKVGWREFVCLFIAAIGMTIGFYFLLRALNTSELIIGTLSLTTSAVAAYLSLRRCSYYALWYASNDIILIVLWSMSVAKYGISYLPMAICFGLFLINDIYGFVRWKLDEKRTWEKTKKQQILVFSDLHGSLNALKQLISSQDWKCADKRIFLGDVVVGFSRPNECIEHLKKEDCICLLGNNDDYIATKIPQADIKDFHDGKLEQIEWMKENISEENKNWLSTLEKEYEIEWGEKKLYFTHYPWEELDGEWSVIDSPKEKTLKERQKMFENIDADYIFFGHEHDFNIFKDDKKQYICLTSAGLENPAQYLMLTLDEDGISIQEKTFKFDIDEEIELMVKAGYPYNKKKYKK